MVEEEIEEEALMVEETQEVATEGEEQAEEIVVAPTEQVVVEPTLEPQQEQIVLIPMTTKDMIKTSSDVVTEDVRVSQVMQPETNSIVKPQENMLTEEIVKNPFHSANEVRSPIADDQEVHTTGAENEFIQAKQKSKQGGIETTAFEIPLEVGQEREVALEAAEKKATRVEKVVEVLKHSFPIEMARKALDMIKHRFKTDMQRGKSTVDHTEQVTSGDRNETHDESIVSGDIGEVGDSLDQDGRQEHVLFVSDTLPNKAEHTHKEGDIVVLATSEVVVIDASGRISSEASETDVIHESVVVQVVQQGEHITVGRQPEEHTENEQKEERGDLPTVMNSIEEVAHAVATVDSFVTMRTGKTEGKSLFEIESSGNNVTDAYEIPVHQEKKSPKISLLVSEDIMSAIEEKTHALENVSSERKRGRPRKHTETVTDNKQLIHIVSSQKELIIELETLREILKQLKAEKTTNEDVSLQDDINIIEELGLHGLSYRNWDESDDTWFMYALFVNLLVRPQEELTYRSFRTV